MTHAYTYWLIRVTKFVCVSSVGFSYGKVLSNISSCVDSEGSAGHC